MDLEVGEQLPQRDRFRKHKVEPVDQAGWTGLEGCPNNPEKPSDVSQPALVSNYEYLDHTADIQIHAWGDTLEEAFAGAALGMYNYMTPLKHVQGSTTREIEAEGHDMQSLLFAFLDECLYTFHTELLVCRSFTVTHLDREKWTIKATGVGEAFELGRHEQGTEVKAITYSAMKITEEEGKPAHIYVIVDI